jgi:hypothetical protein
MRNLVIGTLFGFLVAASVAFAYDVTFPSRLRVQAQALVDEVGNILLGSTPAKIEVTNMPDCSGAPAAIARLKDSNGTTVGTISSHAGTIMVPAPGAAPSGTDSFTLAIGATPSATIVRDVGGILVEMIATHFSLDGNTEPGTDSPFYFSSNDCSGTVSYVPSPWLVGNSNPGSRSFYPASVRVGTTLFYACAPPDDVDVNSYKSSSPGAACTTYAYGVQQVSPVCTLDLEQFSPPYQIERGL